MLAPERRGNFLGAYDGLSPSISLFSAYFGVKEPPQRFGLTDYSTILLPPWMKRLDDYAQAGALLGDPPAGRMPPLTVVNYGVIDAGLNEAGQTLVTVVGVDRVANWATLGREAEAERRSAWLEAILEELERHCPGFAGAVTEKTLVTARSVRDYLDTPEGAVYGFAPTPPERSFLSGVRRSPRTAIPGLFLASSFAGAGGFTGAMGAGAAAAGAAEKLSRACEVAAGGAAQPRRASISATTSPMASEAVSPGSRCRRGRRGRRGRALRAHGWRSRAPARPRGRAWGACPCSRDAGARPRGPDSSCG